MADIANSIDLKLTGKDFLSQAETLLRLTKKLLSYRQKIFSSQRGATGFEFAEYRAYSPGDDLKRLDWNVFHRLQELVVKEYIVENPRYWIFALDCSPSMLFYEKFSLARKMIAFLMYIFLSLGDKAIFSTWPQSKANLCYYKGRKNIYSMLQELENCKTVSSQNKNFSFQNFFASLPKNSRSIIVSDFYDSSVTQEFFSLCHCRNMPAISLHIMAQEEKNSVLKTGRKILQDSESGRTLEIEITPDLLAQYARRFQQHTLEVASLCHQYGISHKEITNEFQFPKDILDILRRAGLLRF